MFADHLGLITKYHAFATAVSAAFCKHNYWHRLLQIFTATPQYFHTPEQPVPVQGHSATETSRGRLSALHLLFSDSHMHPSGSPLIRSPLLRTSTTQQSAPTGMYLSKHVAKLGPEIFFVAFSDMLTHTHVPAELHLCLNLYSVSGLVLTNTIGSKSLSLSSVAHLLPSTCLCLCFLAEQVQHPRPQTLEKREILGPVDTAIVLNAQFRQHVITTKDNCDTLKGEQVQRYR